MANESKPTNCPGCDGVVEPAWKACPHCGAAIVGDAALPGGEDTLRRIAREEAKKLVDEAGAVRGRQPAVAVSVIEELLAGDK